MRRVVFDPPEIEYLGGRPYEKLSLKRTHAVVQLAVCKIFERCAGGQGVTGPEWRVHLSSTTSLVPDVAFVTYDRLRPLSEEQAEEPPFAPDIVAEVRSPSNRAAPVVEKIRLYLAHGSELVLDVDPAQRVVYAHCQGGVSAHREGERFTCAAVPWLQFDVAELFEKLKIPPR